MFIQSNLVFNNILKTLERYLFTEQFSEKILIGHFSSLENIQRLLSHNGSLNVLITNHYFIFLNDWSFR